MRTCRVRSCCWSAVKVRGCRRRSATRRTCASAFPWRRPSTRSTRPSARRCSSTSHGASVLRRPHMESLFPDPPDAAPAETAPLAERMRPRTFDDFVGQDELLAPGKPLREAIERDRLQSLILWGPPGTGKTTLARIIADMTRARFVSFSAVLSGIKDIRDVMAAAERTRRATGRRTIVFIDEIHRFNKAQQDAFLPRVES